MRRIIPAPLLLAGFLAATGCCGGERQRLESENESLRIQLAATEMQSDQAMKDAADCRLQNEALLEEIDGLSRASAPPSWGGGRVGQPGPESVIRCQVEGDHFAVDPTVGEDLRQLSMSMRVVPQYRDGRPSGMKLLGIPTDSLPGSCGFLNGDVITRLNDMPLTNPGEALEAYQRVSDANEAIFEVERGGESISIRIVGRSEPEE